MRVFMLYPMKSLTVALIEPFEYQPFRSIRLLCSLMAEELSRGRSGAPVEVINVTPPSFLGDLTLGVPQIHRAVALFERLFFSSLILRIKLSSLRKKAQKEKRHFVVFLSDQSLGFLATALTGFRVCSFISDLTALRVTLDDFAGLPKSTFGQRFSQQMNLSGLRNCACAVCPSEATAADAKRFLPQLASRVSVAPLCLNYPYAPLPPEELRLRQEALWRKKGVLPRAYLLYMGSSAWYKNREGIVHLCAELKKLTPTPPALVFAGTAMDASELAIAQKGGVEVYSFPDVSNAEMQALYCGAEAFLLLSFNEGFGWPALEALACATPLIITDNSSLKTCFATGASVILETPRPDEIETWAQANAPKLLAYLNASLEERAALIAKGLALAKGFTPEAFRESLLNALESCV